ncbi:D-2-hydroxyacid dehydrogenase family protein [Sorangium sp. So ce1024]|uniref:D-2-hydroxyacid dehydrogenase family protein n=1 Tax=Sorangium sp. So ce1024 TaxID=3133327 RepID=UPI003F526787
MRLAILDDYQGVALRMADWQSLHPAAQVQAFGDHLDDLDALAERLRPFDGVVLMRERTPFPRALLERLPRLRLLVTAGMRNASIDIAAATERGVQVSGTDMLPYPTAELTWGLILALFRQIPREDRATREGRWQTTLGLGLKGKTLGLVGLGRLGGQVARVGSAFGMEVIAWSQNLTAERAAEVGARLTTKDELFGSADVVSIHLVLSPRTRGLVGAAELARMKPTAFLVNTSRGPIVDEEALVAALRGRRIAGAGLDVFEPEPLPAGHPLLALDNTVITPHLGYVTEEGYRLLYGQAVEDIRAFLDGKPLRPLNQVATAPAPAGQTAQ